MRWSSHSTPNPPTSPNTKSGSAHKAAEPDTNTIYLFCPIKLGQRYSAAEFFNRQRRGKKLFFRIGKKRHAAGHTDLLATVGIGRARIKVDHDVRFGAIQGGTLTVLSGAVTLLPITFEFADEIDTARAERARERAEEKLASATNPATEDIARAKLMRALNRLSVAGFK